MGRLAVQENGLTEMQLSFVRAVAGGAPQAVAAQMAGSNHPDIMASRWMRNDAVQAALRKERDAQINGEIAGLAIGALRDVLGDKGQSGANRIKAAKVVLDYAGHTSGGTEAEGIGRKPLADLSVSELEAIVKAGEIALQVHATPVHDAQYEDVTPSEAEQLL